MLLFQIYLVFGWFFLSFFFELFDVFISHILSPCTPRTPFPTMLYSLLSTIWKRQSTVTLFCFFFGRKQTLSNQIWSFLSVSVSYVCVDISIVDLFTKMFGVLVPFLMKSHVLCFLFLFFFLCFFVVIVLEEWTLFFWTFVTNSQSALCVHGHEQNVSAEKKASKRSKKLKKKKNKRSGCVCSDLVLFIKTKKYWHWTKWTKNKKSIFYSVYMEIKIPVCCIALLYKSNVLVAFF